MTHFSKRFVVRSLFFLHHLKFIDLYFSNLFTVPSGAVWLCQVDFYICYLSLVAVIFTPRNQCNLMVFDHSAI